MPVIELTQKIVDGLRCPVGESKIEFVDSKLPGHYVEVTASGRATFRVRYRSKASGGNKHVAIGSTALVSLADARNQARSILAGIHAGADPSAEKARQKTVPTLRTFVEEQYLPYIKARKRSWKGDRNRLQQRLLPAFGDLPLNAITRKMLVDFHLSLKDEGLAGATCDHFPKLLRALYNVAMGWGVVTENPAAKIALFNEWNQVENYLTEDQLRKLLSVLQSHEQQQACLVARLLLASGTRLNEALSATWEQFDLVEGVWKIPASNSKSKKVRAVPLNESARAVLEGLQVESKAGPVFVNPRTGLQLKTVHKAWSKIRAAAGVPFLRIHDLRHLHASFLVNAGRTLYEVQQLLGHSSPLVTQRYAHLNQRTLQAASESVSGRIQAATPKLLPILSSTPA